MEARPLVVPGENCGHMTLDLLHRVKWGQFYAPSNTAPVPGQYQHAQLRGYSKPAPLTLNHQWDPATLPLSQVSTSTPSSVAIPNPHFSS
ncbi:hypothetical protein P7K49_008928 [Saguinus oedipus]|uniref:Uncharacterized protein n=1 Tax=Saguinus oedipus TaxID=9490 RepID=A0ABQ9VZ49_SAGOE|nr:hypothetical protein P7K49_008928 [Saguinus oedipus]